MSNWKILVPLTADIVNLISNPSFETGMTNWTNINGAASARDAANATRRLYSAKVSPANGSNLSGIVGNNITVTNSLTYYTKFDFVGASGVTYVLQIGFGIAVLEEWTGTGALQQLEFSGTANAGGVVNVTIQRRFSGTADDFYVDRVIFTETSDIPYFDGDSPGAFWNGAENISTSTLSHNSRANGEIKDLKDDYLFGVRDVIGTGYAPLTVGVDNFAIQPGGVLNNIKTMIRPWTLVGTIIGNCDLLTARKNIIAVLSEKAVPQDAHGFQPVRIRYTGGTTTKEIAAHLETGLGVNWSVENQIHERLPLRFLSPNPFWYDILDSSMLLDEEDSATLRYVAARASGQWSDLGLSANPDTNGTVYAIQRAADGTFFVGGDFEGFDGNAGWDYLVNYDPFNDTWTRVGGASDLNGMIMGLAVDAAGDLYVVGEFTSIGAVGANSWITRWDGTNYNAVGDPTAGAAAITTVFDVEINSVGSVIVCGEFLNFANDADADYMAFWNGAAWGNIGTPSAGATITRALDLAIDSDDNIYVVGVFTNWAGVATGDRIARWNGSAWVGMGGGFNNDTLSVVVATDGTVYASGSFTQTGDAAVTDITRVAQWNGVIWSKLGDGCNNTCRDIKFAPDGTLWATGAFTSAGGRTVNGLARWTGDVWLPVDVDLPGSPIGRVLEFGPPDVVVQANHDTYVGFSTTGAATYGGDATVTHDGTAQAFPLFVAERSGGTSATLVSLRNKRTGKELLFEFALLDGERLSVNLDPFNRAIVSNWRGVLPSAVLDGSDLGDWNLLPGDNEVTCFINNNGATVAAYLIWNDTFESFDD